MARAKLRNPNIFALESIWSNRIVYPYPTVNNILATIQSNSAHFQYTVLNSNTVQEVEHSLEVAKKSVKNFGILYFASHGKKDGIITLSHRKKTFMSLDYLADLLGTRFKSWAVHFGACSVLETEPQMIRYFMDTTGVQMLSGYTKDVYWIESTALELLFFHTLTDPAYYKHLHKYREEWFDTYSFLSEKNGFEIYLKGD